MEYGKMKPIGIELIRYPYEEPYHLNLAFSATNGLFSGYLEYYCNADDLAEIGQALHTFPKRSRMSMYMKSDQHVQKIILPIFSRSALTQLI